MSAAISAQDHWTHKQDVKLFLFEKYAGTPGNKPAVLFVHGSSMASQPTFDLKVPGRPHSSAMDYFVEKGFDTWCVDMEGYGRPTKSATSNATSPTVWTIWLRPPTTS